MAGGLDCLLLVIGGTFLVGVAALVHWLCRRSQGPDWLPVGTLRAINLYPLKSGAPTVVPHARCQELGLRYKNLTDRMFVVYDEEGKVVTARCSPNLLRIKVLPTSSPNSVRFTSSSGRDFFEIDLTDVAVSTTAISMKFPTTDTEILHTRDCGDDVAAWMSLELDRPGVRLGFWPSGFGRDIMKSRSREIGVFKICNNIAAIREAFFAIVEPAKKLGLDINQGKAKDMVTGEVPDPNETISFGDYTFTKISEIIYLGSTLSQDNNAGGEGAYSNMSSFLLLNCSSVDDLVGRLDPDSSVGPDNFRGNILITGAEPYAEDHWDMIRIGNASFRIVKPCVRCVMVTIDPKTLVTDPNMEPLKTLKTYRQLTDPEQREIEGDRPVMGCYMGLNNVGDIKVGDTVYAVATQPKEKIFKMFQYF